MSTYCLKCTKPLTRNEQEMFEAFCEPCYRKIEDEWHREWLATGTWRTIGDHSGAD